jgi:phosphopantetheine adenylyltransferase
VSEESRKGGEGVNEFRRQNNLPEIKLYVLDYISGAGEITSNTT